MAYDGDGDYHHENVMITDVYRTGQTGDIYACMVCVQGRHLCKASHIRFGMLGVVIILV